MFNDLPSSTKPLVASYNSIRRAVGFSGLLLPILLGPIGWLFFGIEFQDNMSSYYHTPLRDVFVGTLCAMGIFLFCYQGHDWVENWTANLGCVFAIGVALFPLDQGSDPLLQKSIIGYLHTAFGGAFFLTLAFYSLHHFPSSESNAESEPHERQRDFVYRISGITILLSMLACGIYLFMLPTPWKLRCNQFNLLFWLEWIAVWAFAAAWLTKGRIIIADVAIDLLAVVQEKFESSHVRSLLADDQHQRAGYWRKLRDWGLLTVGGLGVLVTLLPFLPTGWWVVRCWDFPRLQLAVMLTAILITCFVIRPTISKKLVVIAKLLLLAAAIFQWWHVAKFTPLWAVEVPNAEQQLAVNENQRRDEQPARFSVVTINVEFENQSYQKVAERIRELAPDLLVLIEVNEAWRAGISSLEDQYRFRHDVVRERGTGICLWSKFSLDDVETRFLIEDDRPSIWTTATIGNQQVHLVAVHPTPPGLQKSGGDERTDSRVRDAELVVIAKEIAERTKEHWIVVGDFNDVAWSHTTRLFKRLSGLKDPRVGRSFMGTFHANYPLLRFPIDHVFVSDGFHLHDIARHNIPGSDHFAVSTDLRLAIPSTGTTPEPQHDDHLEAKELIEAGKQDAQENDQQHPAPSESP